LFSDDDGQQAKGLQRGAYVLWQSTESQPEVILIGSGSETQFALAAGKALAAEGVNARVVSMPSWELFDRQPAEYRESVLPGAVRARVAVEAAIKLGWERYVGLDGAVVGMADIQAAADILRPLFDQTGGRDGFVSLEVSPTLAHDTSNTITEARRLHAALNRPNVMIKAPATAAGLPAVTALIGDGISVNVTLIFSASQYEAVAEAYLAGLEQLAARGGDLSQVASVASFFVSRVDTAVDAELEKLGERALQGPIAVANSKAAYARFQALFGGQRWTRLVAQGARVQRPLWASTGTKNPAYPDTLYVDALIGPDTVNTVPPATRDAFLDRGRVAAALEQDLDEALADLDRLAELGIDLDAIAGQLLDDGVAAFAKSFETLLASVAAKRAKLLAGKQSLPAGQGEFQRQSEAVPA
jgi:transaldolase